jgi:hypothetical protein
MKIQLRNRETGEITSYEDYLIEVWVGDNDEHLVLTEDLADFVDANMPYIDEAVE